MTISIIQKIIEEFKMTDVAQVITGPELVSSLQEIISSLRELDRTIGSSRFPPLNHGVNSAFAVEEIIQYVGDPENLRFVADYHKDSIMQLLLADINDRGVSDQMKVLRDRLHDTIRGALAALSMPFRVDGFKRFALETAVLKAVDFQGQEVKQNAGQREHQFKASAFEIKVAVHRLFDALKQQMTTISSEERFSFMKNFALRIEGRRWGSFPQHCLYLPRQLVEEQPELSSLLTVSDDHMSSALAFNRAFDAIKQPMLHRMTYTFDFGEAIHDLSNEGLKNLERMTEAYRSSNYRLYFQFAQLMTALNDLVAKRQALIRFLKRAIEGYRPKTKCSVDELFLLYAPMVVLIRAGQQLRYSGLLMQEMYDEPGYKDVFERSVTEASARLSVISKAASQTH
jgi:hypothetical protein